MLINFKAKYVISEKKNLLGIGTKYTKYMFLQSTIFCDYFLLSALG